MSTFIAIMAFSFIPVAVLVVIPMLLLGKKYYKTYFLYLLSVLNCVALCASALWLLLYANFYGLLDTRPAFIVPIILFSMLGILQIGCLGFVRSNKNLLRCLLGVLTTGVAIWVSWWLLLDVL